jgi:hypothetical protein
MPTLAPLAALAFACALVPAAAGAAPTPERLVLRSPMTVPARAAAGDLVPDLRAPDAGGGADAVAGIAGIACAVIPGFGLGHLFIGDWGGTIFFALMEAGILAAGLTLFVISVVLAVITGANPAFALLANLAFVVAFGGMGVVHVWQIVDLIIKVATGQGGGGSLGPAPRAPSESIARAAR